MHRFFRQPDFVIHQTSTDFHDFSWTADVFNTCFHVSFQVRNRLDDWTTEGPTTTSPRRPLGGMPPGEKECAEICGMHLEEARPLRDAMKIAFIYDTCITQTYIYIHSIYIYRYKQQEWIDS